MWHNLPPPVWRPDVILPGLQTSAIHAYTSGTGGASGLGRSYASNMEIHRTMVPDHLATRTLHFDALLACSYHHHQLVNGERRYLRLSNGLRVQFLQDKCWQSISTCRSTVSTEPDFGDRTDMGFRILGSIGKLCREVSLLLCPQDMTIY